MAEGLARTIALEYGLSVEVQSAGTMRLRNRPADPHSVAVLHELGIDISRHKSQGVSVELVDWANYILVMEMRHAHKMRMEFSNIENKLMMLGPFGGRQDISDPIGGWKFQFRWCRNKIDRSIRSFFDQLRLNLSSQRQK